MLAQPTPLLGRALELETIEHRLVGDGVRLLSLTGPAGVGKTRLALETQIRLADRFPDGITLVDLTPVRTADLVLPAISHRLGLTDIGSRLPPTRLQDYLHGRELMLILDNFEQVLPAAADIAHLLATFPTLRIMVTSRVPLHLRWEQTLRIVPLAVPDRDSTLPLEDLMRIPPVALFVERVRAQRADFTVAERQAGILVRLTRQLDGLPLAIELAAANMNVLPLAAIAGRIEHRLQTLHWDAHDLPDRQRSLHAAIGWSYDLLPPSEQRLFRHLGVFVGTVSTKALCAVAGTGDEEQTLDSVVSLAEKGLVLPANPEVGGPVPTFRMLETMRQFAHALLDAAGEVEAAGRAHARFFAELAGRADQLRRSDKANQYQVRKRQEEYRLFESEHDNLLAALRWLSDHEEPEEALRLVAALAHFWWVRGHHAEALHWTEQALRLTADANTAVRTRTLLRAGLLLMYSGDLQRSRPLLEEALALSEDGRDRVVMTQSLTYLGLCSAFAGELTEGRRIVHEAVRQADALADEYQIGMAHAVFSYLAALQGDHKEAAAHDLASLPFGNAASATVLRFHQALVLKQPDDPPKAARLIEEGLKTGAELGNRWLLCLGVHAGLLLMGDSPDAEQRARLLGAADMLVGATGSPYGTLERASGLSLVGLRSRLSEPALEASYREGRRLQVPETVALTIGLLENFSRGLAGTETSGKKEVPKGVLSAREVEVLQWVAEGLTSKQIGKQLFLSPKTVNHHLTSVFNKLSVDSRAQAVAVATRKGLL
jgi:predicted ATPase/DNA-binding CsgD family transcriptional regulator